MRKILSTLMLGSRQSLLRAFATAGLLAVLPLTASADTVLTGNTFYAEDFEDPGIDGDHPTSSSGEIAWGAFGPTSTTRTVVGPVDPENIVLQFDGLAVQDGPNMGRKGLFSSTMQAAVPTASSVSFRFYVDTIFFSADQRDMRVFMAMKDVNANTISTQNTLFGLVANPGVGGGAPSTLELVTPGLQTEIRSFVLGEWIDAKIDYDLAATTDNLKVTLNSDTINNESFTFTKDLAGTGGAASVGTNGFYSFNGGENGFNIGVGNKYMLDDINWLLTSESGDPGDFDSDGDVDGADFLKWQRDDASAGGLSDWQSGYGNGASVASLSAVPEPNSCLLLLLGLAVTSGIRRK